MSMKIRSAQAADQENVVALWRACNLVPEENDPAEEFEFAKQGETSDVLLAVDEADQIKAVVMVGHDGHRGWLYKVASDPRARGRGFGRAIVQAAEDWLGERGVERVQLLVLPTNQSVLDFYNKIGYATLPRIVMRKLLKR